MARAVRLAAVLAGLALATPAAPARAGITPSQGQVVDAGTLVEGECTLQDGVVDGRSTDWEIAGVIPGFNVGKKTGAELVPRAESLPRMADAPVREPFRTEWVMRPKVIATPVPGVGCNMQSFDPLGAIEAVEAGPHVFTQFVHTVHYVEVGPDGDDPTPVACAGNDPHDTSPADIAPPPPNGDNHWSVSTFCNTAKTVGFYVRAATSCPMSGDMSGWPGTPYIQQYDVGKRLKLPARHGKKGGNACGPSSLLMVMLRNGGAADLPTLEATFDATMQKARKDVKDEDQNQFAGDPKGVRFAKSLGWRDARTVGLGNGVEIMTERLLTSLAKGPLVLSTAFGTARWGVTGGGHMIAVMGADPRGHFIVADPAGNYFAEPKGGDFPSGHYGPGSCGWLALYPHYWLLAYATDRWFLELGRRGPPPPPKLTPKPRKRPAKRKRTRRSATAAAVKPKLGSAISVSDEHPGGADAPASFYLQDPAGRRAGFIDGQLVQEIPGAAVGQDVPSDTAPAAGDPDFDPNPVEPGPNPRAISLPGDLNDVKLHVSAAKGARFALRAELMVDGALVTSDVVSGTGTGAASRVDSPAFTEAVLPSQGGADRAGVRAGTVAVPLFCTADSGSPCRLAATLSARQGKRDVVLAKGGASVRDGTEPLLRLKPTAAGKRLMRDRRKQAATLVVTQVRPGGAVQVVRTQKLRV